jgi:inhibitor of cysteine peptidase
MSRHARISGVLLCLCLCLCLWAGAKAGQAITDKPPAKATAPAVTLGEEDNGKTVDLTPDGRLIVKLKSNPTTGYAWAVAGDPSPLKLEKASYRKKTATSQLAGAPGVQVFQFHAGSAGMANLTLNYCRSWEHNVVPAKTFSVKVNVH